MSPQLKLHGVDAVEFSVSSISKSEPLLDLWGFKKLKSHEEEGTRHALWAQGHIRFLLSEGVSDRSPAKQFIKKHGDGISNVYLLVDDAAEAQKIVVSRGATAHGSTSIRAMGDVLHTFVSTKNSLEGSEKPKGLGLFSVDHLTCNVPAGELEKWADFYQKIFGFKVTRFFHITTGRTGLRSKVLENSEGTVKIPINEPTETKSQIQEYLDVNHGPGVQHLALATADILKSLPPLKEKGQKFLDVPDTYYDAVPGRVPNIKEDLGQIKRHRILVDGDKAGYILQIFSENVVGPFFYEVIQRNGHAGFGEGNFQALFEAIERDQEKRGVL